MERALYSNKNTLIKKDKKRGSGSNPDYSKGAGHWVIELSWNEKFSERTRKSQQSVASRSAEGEDKLQYLTWCCFIHSGNKKMQFIWGI